MPGTSPDTLSHELGTALQRVALGDTAARDRLSTLFEMRIVAHANRMLSSVPAGGQCHGDDEVVEAAVHRLQATLRALERPQPNFAVAIGVAAIRRVILSLALSRLGRPEEPAPQANADPRPDTPGRWELFFESVERLPALQRQVFHLVWFMGADPRTVSLITGRSRQTVRRCWRRARTTLTRALGNA